jgi:hypothetical protein
LIGIVISLLPGSFNLKRSELHAFALGQLILEHSIHSAASRTLVQRSPQLCQQRFIAGSHNLNVTLNRVPHPATQAEFSRLTLHKPAEANALNSAFDEEMKHHMQDYARLM